MSTKVEKNNDKSYLSSTRVDQYTIFRLSRPKRNMKYW